MGGKVMTLKERARLLRLPVTEIAREAKRDRMTVHRLFAGEPGLTSTHDAVHSVIVARERFILTRLIKLHGDWLNENPVAAPVHNAEVRQ